MASNYIQGNMSYTGGQNITSGSSALKQVQSNVRDYVSKPGHDVLSDAVLNTQNAPRNAVNSARKAINDSAHGKEKSLDDIYGPGVRPWDPPGSSDSQPQLQDYLDAPWASAYGMSKETAYNEAMTNTEYRRAVKDMQAAGLNPAVIFGAGKGSTAGVPGYISSSSGGGGGGGGGGRSYGGRSGNNKNGYLFSGSAYSVMSALGGIVGAAATKSAGGYWIGTSLAQGAMHAASSFSKWLKR